MSEARTCLNCGTTFYSNYFFGPFKCNICLQTEAIEKQAELTRNAQYESDRRRTAEYNRINSLQNERLRQDAMLSAQAMQDATVQAMNAVANVLDAIETKVSKKDAYNFGYNYIDKHFNVSGVRDTINLNVHVLENGTVQATWNNYYRSSELNQQFTNGISARMAKLPVANKSVLLAQAKQAGLEIALGNLTPYFSLHTEIYLNGKELLTIEFNSNLNKTVDEKTGLVTTIWDHPFVDNQMNQYFCDGVNEALLTLNNQENLNARLSKILAENKEIAKYNRNDIISRLLYITLPFSPFLGWYLVWQYTFGVTCLVASVIGVPLVTVALYVIYELWKDKNGLL